MNKTYVLYDKNAFCHIICMQQTICKHYYLFCSEIDAFFRWCITSNRNFVGLFIDDDYCTIAQTKILEHHFDVKTMTTHYAY